MALKGLVASIVILFSLIATASFSPFPPETAKHLSDYYGPGLYSSMINKEIADDNLRGALHDRLANGHRGIGYDAARKEIFGKLSLKQDGNEYYIDEVYCEKPYGNREFPKLGLGPNVYPKNGDILNTEHTWPQSRFTSKYPTGTQKADIHHLFPSDSKMNSFRGNLEFGDVVSDRQSLNCPNGFLGKPASGDSTIFEAPKSHRGNIARAIFYFAVRYDTNISPEEEKSLRRWNDEDPVDDAEMARNDGIEKIQGNRNPFIDMPELVEQIHNF